MRAHDVARRDVCRWIARCQGLAGAIDAGLLGRHQQQQQSWHFYFNETALGLFSP
jgi:hypothetical protein